jgi:CheY-like chemotaxis protein
MARILVIEDEAPIRGNLVRFLKLEGYEVESADNGADGLTAALANPPDLIICDLLMPKVDGYAVLSGLHANPPTAAIPFLLVTASADKSERIKSAALGATHLVTKPFDLSELREVIKRYIAK